MNNEQNQSMIMVFKMITGEKIVAEFDNDNSTDEYIVVKRPLQLHSAKDVDENGEALHYNYFHVWNQLTDEEVFFVPYMHIITANEASKSLKNFFDKSSKMFYNDDKDGDDEEHFTQSTGENDSYETINMSEDDAYEYLLKQFSANTVYMN